MTADRQVTPKLWEVKKVYQYITLEPNAENSIGVRNRYAFLNLHDFNLRYVILKDGVPIAEEEFSLPDGKPRRASCGADTLFPLFNFRTVNII